MKKVLKQLTNGLINENPSLVLLLGMCATMAVTTSIQNGIGMGLSTTAVLICSNLVISLMRNIIPSKIRIAAYVVIIGGFVTIVDQLLQAFAPSLSNSLGVFIPLIVVNCIILGRAEAFASKNGPLLSAADGLSMGIGFTLTLTAMSIIREFIGSGTLLGFRVTPAAYEPMNLIVMPVGGFLTLGFLIALVQWAKSRKGAKK